MNRKQKLVIGVGTAIILLMGLFPPCLLGRYFYGYHLICTTGGWAIDTDRLLIQWAAVIIVVTALVLILKKEDKA